MLTPHLYHFVEGLYDIGIRSGDVQLFIPHWFPNTESLTDESNPDATNKRK